MPVITRHDLYILTTKQTAYALGINREGLLTHAYWGPALPYLNDYPAPPTPAAWGPFNNLAHLTAEEYPAWEDMKFIEPCLKVSHADGVRDLSPRFDRAEYEGEMLHLHLVDAVYSVRLTLHYRTVPDHDLIERWATIHNAGQDALHLERIFSAQWHPPVGNRARLSHLHGRWFDEMHLTREPLRPGVKVLESRRLTSSHHHQPWFALDRGDAEEERGEVWYGLLDWSGNWKLTAEVTDFFSTRISIGLNDWDFAWTLAAGGSFETPHAFAGYTPGGFGAASRALHDFVRERVLPNPQVVHKVYYNSWEATLFDVTHESQIHLAKLAASLGAEMFMIDDGWYRGRFSQASGLGDWLPDPQKFPLGLPKLIEEINALGMDFGLWFEPEMVNPDSQLYREHPDWVIHFPTRERRLGRDSLHLNLAREDVQTYLIDSLDRMFATHNIRYANWDMNRNVSEPGWEREEGEARELWVRYVQGLYHVWNTIRQRHPQVIWQSCSGGGGRIDLGMLRVSDMIWISDNSGAAYRLGIQQGYTQMFPATTMQAWVTDQQTDVPFDFRFHSAMCGLLGLGANITQWSEAELERARHWISLYKSIRHLIQFGDLYRLRSADETGFTAVEYLSKDQQEGVLFAFRTYIGQHEPSLTLRLRGLKSDTLYRVEGFDGVRSGTAWMNRDLEFGLQGGLENFGSTMRRIVAVLHGEMTHV
jgi:alpha-galactosidase